MPDSEPEKSTSLSSEEIASLMQKLDKNHLITEKGLNLDFFNSNLENASNNLAFVVPQIVDVSKEQISIINNGLENVINFMRAFQIVNTTFAMMARTPTKINEFKEDLNKVKNLETDIVLDVKSSLNNLSKTLAETFKKKVKEVLGAHKEYGEYFEGLDIECS